MEVETINVERITPSPHQPRESFPKDELGSLAGSIAEHGLLQPLIVRPTDNDTFQIIAGERRWRAAQLTDIKEVPAIVKDVDSAEQMAESLIENIHREDLAPIEKGRATHQLFLLNEVDMEPKDIADKLNTINSKCKNNLDKYAHEASYNNVINYCRDDTEKNIVRVMKKDIAKGFMTVYNWLRSISVSKTIQKTEAERATEERVSERVLSRLSTIDSKTEQKKAYRKIKRDEMDHQEASKFISWVKQQDEDTREMAYETDVEVDVGAPDMGLGEVEPELISEEEAEEVRAKVEKVKKKTEETLAKPKVQRKGNLRRNWQALSSILNQLGDVFCPKCGLDEEGEPKTDWKEIKFECHDIDLKEAQEIARQEYQEAVGGEED